MITPSGATLRVVISLMLATALAAVTASVALAAGAAPCRVSNVTQDTFGRSLIRMVERAVDGDRLWVRGRCRGEIVIDVDVVIRGVGDSATLAGGSRNRVVRIPQDADVVLRDFTVQRGSASQGGGILNRGTLRLLRVTVQDNFGVNDGGGILSRGTLTMVDSVVRRNHAWYAGGLSVRGTATLIRTRVRANRASDQGEGGGILTGGTLTLIDSVVARNKVDFGAGGGIDNSGTLILVDSIIRGNRVRLSSGEPGWGSGGGIQNSGGVDLIGSTVTNNTSADEGGGIYNWASPGTVSLDAGSSVTGNSPDNCFGTPAC